MISEVHLCKDKNILNKQLGSRNISIFVSLRDSAVTSETNTSIEREMKLFLMNRMI